jgi:hypothetical protein
MRQALFITNPCRLSVISYQLSVSRLIKQRAAVVRVQRIWGLNGFFDAPLLM